METIAILAAVGLFFYFSQKGTPSGGGSVSNNQVAPPGAAQQPVFRAGVFGASGLTSGGYRIVPPSTPILGRPFSPASGIPLPTVPPYVLPPVPPPILRPSLSMSGPGSGGNPLTGQLRTGISAGTGTTAPPTSSLQLRPRTSVL